jgi:predicted ATPase with chaperone activity
MNEASIEELKQLLSLSSMWPTFDVQAWAGEPKVFPHNDQLLPANSLGILKLQENNRSPALDTFRITGELALSGQLLPVKGVLSIALEAKRLHR